LSDIKEPWKEWPDIWSSKAKFMSYLRGGIRRAIWNRSPIKHSVIHKKRKRVLNGKTGNMVWGGTCYICKQDFVASQLQVDHIKGEHSLKELSDIQSFVEAMTCLSEDDLDTICEVCHQFKSHAERKRLSFEEAVIDKKAIEFMKKPVKDVVKVLTEHNLPSNNSAVRRKGIKQLFEEGKLK